MLDNDKKAMAKRSLLKHPGFSDKHIAWIVNCEAKMARCSAQRQGWNAALLLALGLLICITIFFSESVSSGNIESASKLLKLGCEAYEAHNMSDAIELFSEALNIYKDNEDTQKEQAKCYANIGFTLLYSEKYKDAARKLKQAIKIYQTIDDTAKDQAECYEAMGSVFERISKHKDSKKAYEKALALYLAVENAERDQADCYTGIGLALLYSQKDKDAITKCGQALRIYQTIEDTEQEQAYCHILMGDALKYTGKYEEARANYDRALEICQSVENSEEYQAYCYMNMGEALENLGQYVESEANYMQALEIYQTIEGTEGNQKECRRGLRRMRFELLDIIILWAKMLTVTPLTILVALLIVLVPTFLLTNFVEKKISEHHDIRVSKLIKALMYTGAGIAVILFIFLIYTGGRESIGSGMVPKEAEYFRRWFPRILILWVLIFVGLYAGLRISWWISDARKRARSKGHKWPSISAGGGTKPMKRLFFLSIAFTFVLIVFFSAMEELTSSPDDWGVLIAFVAVVLSAGGIVTLGIGLIKNIIKQIRDALK